MVRKVTKEDGGVTKVTKEVGGVLRPFFYLKGWFGLVPIFGLQQNKKLEREEKS